MFPLFVSAAMAGNFVVDAPYNVQVGVTRQLGKAPSWGAHVQFGVAALPLWSQWEDPSFWGISPAFRLDMDGFRRPRFTGLIQADLARAGWLGGGIEAGWTWTIPPDGLRGPRLGASAGYVLPESDVFLSRLGLDFEIGRASCRERV